MFSFYEVIFIRPILFPSLHSSIGQARKDNGVSHGFLSGIDAIVGVVVDIILLVVRDPALLVLAQPQQRLVLGQPEGLVLLEGPVLLVGEPTVLALYPALQQAVPVRCL